MTKNNKRHRLWAVAMTAGVSLAAGWSLFYASVALSADEAESALVRLGFSRQQSKDALARVPAGVKNPEERVKIALKNLGK